MTWDGMLLGFTMVAYFERKNNWYTCTLGRVLDQLIQNCLWSFVVNQCNG